MNRESVRQIYRSYLKMTTVDVIEAKAPSNDHILVPLKLVQKHLSNLQWGRIEFISILKSIVS